ncbi:hypothetical protein LSH36_64g01000 [Paralvinella palmiformis]|uniref:Single-pass membrane and coiled-coil domain-containing protein 4 homolog n=1 Tax=Paralvinella palmiformis TaxID=53620 RepID=A0AAD9NBZ0_9ANNE|nr:hypothetical protein LSH36_64g01000 [Paralvinella palmiformis]
MRQLKGKVKESRKEKRERKMENLQNKQNLFRIVLPTLTAVFVLIAAYVFYSTRASS